MTDINVQIGKIYNLVTMYLLLAFHINHCDSIILCMYMYKVGWMQHILQGLSYTAGSLFYYIFVNLFISLITSSSPFYSGRGPITSIRRYCPVLLQRPPLLQAQSLKSFSPALSGVVNWTSTGAEVTLAFEYHVPPHLRLFLQRVEGNQYQTYLEMSSC